MNASDGVRLWSGRLEQRPERLDALGSDAVWTVIQALGFSLDKSAIERLQTNLVRKAAAYQLFGQARNNPRNTKDGITKAIGFLNQAILTDPDFALAHAWLAQVYGESAGWHLPPKQALTEAKKNAVRAIHLDGTLASAHLSLAQVLFHLEGDWVAAEAAYERAAALDPRSGFTLGWFGGMLSAIGRFDKADAVLKRAEELEPQSQIVLTAIARNHYTRRRLQDAKTYVLRTFRFHPKDVVAHQLLALVETRLGNLQEALAAAQKAKQMDPAPDMVALLGVVHASAGQRTDAEHALKELRDIALRGFYVAPQYSALVYAALGDVDKVIEALEKASGEVPLRAEILQNDRAWDYVRDDPKFRTFVRKLALER